MPKIITRTIKAPKRKAQRKPTDELAAYQRRQARQERAQKQLTIRADGVTRCSKCPPTTFCEDCARINKARQHAGLIHPYGSPEPHPNNCMPCIPREQHYMGQRPYKVPSTGYEVVSIEVENLGGGWYRGVATLGRQEIYSKKFRSRDAAFDYARRSMVCIRQGLAWERENA